MPSLKHALPFSETSLFFLDKKSTFDILKSYPFAEEVKSLKFRLEDISKEGQEAMFSQAESWLDGRLAGEAKRSFNFIGPIRVYLNLSRSGRMVWVKSRIEVRVEWLCARCLESFSRTLTSEYTASLKPRPDSPSQPREEVELSREDIETEFYEGEEIDLTPLVQDQALLALPQKVICRDDCLGLCPRCGKNLNRESCQCQKRIIDPRFEPLRGFKVH